MRCNHDYVYTQGYFVCTKCNKKTYGRSHKKRGAKKIGFGITGLTVIGIVVFLFVNGTIEFNRENLQESIQNIPQNIQDTADTAKDLVAEASTKLTETMDKQKETSQTKPDKILDKPTTEIPKDSQESDPVNEKPTIDTYELEKQVHQLTNQYRIQNGLTTLAWDDRLSDVARNHSKDMASRSYFSHDTPDGIDPTGRGAIYGYNCEKRVGNLIYSGIAENIFQNNLYDTVWYTNGIPTSYEWNSMDEIAQSTVGGWMDSPGHRQNILTSTYDNEGIGVAISSDDKVYITQNFC